MANEYRIIRHVEQKGDETVTWFAVHEVYIGDDDDPQSCSAEPVALKTDTFEQMAAVLERMRHAVNLEILDYDDVGP